MAGDGLEQPVGTDREVMLRGEIIPRAMNLCHYLDTEGIAKLQAGHGVEEKITIAVGKMNVQVIISVRKGDI